MTIDEKISVMQAFKEGKEVEFIMKNYSIAVWKPIFGTPVWNFQECDYRAKPEPEPPKYVPFTFEDDLVGMAVVRNDEKGIITNQRRNHVLVSGYSWIDYDGFLKNYTFTDGSQCGKLQTNE